jgi:hypothetical protein
MGTVEIPIDRYNELITLEARINTLVRLIGINKYISTMEMLEIIGTDFAWEVSLEVKKRDENLSRKLEESAKARALKELNESYQAIKEEVSE